MTRDEAIARLLEIAKGRINIVDGEWGCDHTYKQALNAARCDMHDEAVEIAALEAVLTIAQPVQPAAVLSSSRQEPAGLTQPVQPKGTP